MMILTDAVAQGKRLQKDSLFQAKALLMSILALVAVLSLFLKPDPYPGLYYVVNGFVITEWTVVGTALFFDANSDRWRAYKIRKESPDVSKLIERSCWDRIFKYKTEWMGYYLFWLLSKMTFEDTYPGVFWSVAQVYALCVVYDAYAYLAHKWMHTARKGLVVHKKHHSFRYVTCWFVDHESYPESLLMGVGKHGILALVSPHPRTAFEYLFVIKFWNVIAHCGYNLPIFAFIDRYLPFSGTPNRHEQHHYHGEANLAIVTTVFDYLGGTLVWTDEEAIEWRRQRRAKGITLGESITTWKLDSTISQSATKEN